VADVEASQFLATRIVPGQPKVEPVPQVGDILLAFSENSLKHSSSAKQRHHP
jgi:hypothetical protein